MKVDRKLRATPRRVLWTRRMFVPLSRETLWICVQTAKPLHAVAKSQVNRFCYVDNLGHEVSENAS